MKKPAKLISIVGGSVLLAGLIGCSHTEKSNYERLNSFFDKSRNTQTWEGFRTNFDDIHLAKNYSSDQIEKEFRSRRDYLNCLRKDKSISETQYNLLMERTVLGMKRKAGMLTGEQYAYEMGELEK